MNDDDNIFLLKFTRKDLECMIKKIDDLSQDTHSLIADFKELHRQLHDSDAESNSDISNISNINEIVIEDKTNE